VRTVVRSADAVHTRLDHRVRRMDGCSYYFGKLVKRKLPVGYQFRQLKWWNLQTMDAVCVARFEIFSVTDPGVPLFFNLSH
jgi:hypothetical protein